MEIYSPSSLKWFTKPNYLTVMGSRAYGVHNENSDYDFYGFVVPPIEIVFPHLKGEINGFGTQRQNFEQFEAQKIKMLGHDDVDITVYSITKYFQLLMGGNPNIIDSLFTHTRHKVVMDDVGKLVYKNRKLFLSQKCYHTFKGMMWSHLSRIKSGHIKEGRKNQGFDWDVKDGYHSLRMALQLEQILFEGDLDLEANAPILIGVRSGFYSKDRVIEWCEDYLKVFEAREKEFVIAYAPDEKKIKALLVECLEMEYSINLNAGFSFGSF